jgi:hypothetical protein
MTRLATLALSAVLYAAVAAYAQDTARMDQVIQSHVSAGTFMGTVLVARDGAVIVDKAYGDDHPRRRRLDGAAHRPGPPADLPAIRDSVLLKVVDAQIEFAAARKPRGADR